jgi:hypothetical protein
VKVIGGDSPISSQVLAHYGITREGIESWGGSMQSAVVASFLEITEFDLIVSELASPANNPESSIWTLLSQEFDLYFLDLPDELLDSLATTPELGLQRVTAKWGLLRGVDRPIPTVARSGEAVFAREDTPDDAAYDVARAIDAHRAALKWYIRPYAYDPDTVWKNLDVPLHPGAERYYREAGYLAPSGDAMGSSGGGNATEQPASETPETKDALDQGCALATNRGSASPAHWLVVASIFGWALRRPRRRGGQRLVHESSAAGGRGRREC